MPYPSHSAARKPADDVIAKTATRTIEEFNAAFDQFQLSKALETAWGLVAAVDKYIVENEPWALADKRDEQSLARLATVLYTSAEALRIVTALSHPIIPESTAKIWMQLGLGDIRKYKLAELKWGQLPLGTKLGKVEAVFPRADKSSIERMQQMEQERIAAPEPKVETAAAGASDGGTATAVVENPPTSSGFTPLAPQITIDDFAKVDLRVAVIKHAEKVKGADKLLRLEVDLGFEQRQIVAGIALAYEPEKLIGRKIVIVANLAPRKLRGLESNGMLLAASLEGGVPVLAGFHEETPIGARLK